MQSLSDLWVDFLLSEAERSDPKRQLQLQQQQNQQQNQQQQNIDRRKSESSLPQIQTQPISSTSTLVNDQQSSNQSNAV
jgi:hypothetical protein